MAKQQRPEGYYRTEKARQRARKWRENNRQKQRKWFAHYRQENSEKIREQQKAYRERHKHSPSYKLRKNLRERLRSALRGLSKSKSTMLLVGCSVEELKIHLEKQFKTGMTWDNYGKGWHIDHIKPCSRFDLLNAEEQLICFHYTNLQPLWASDNISKGNRLTSDQVSVKVST